MRYVAALLLSLVAMIAAAQVIAPVTIPAMPGRIVDVTPSDDSADNFAPSIIVCSSAVEGTVTAVPVLPVDATPVTWTFTGENFVVPGIYVRVNATATTATDCKRLQVDA